MNNMLILPEDGWVEIATSQSGMFTMSTGGQYCTYVGQPPVDFVGHRYSGKPVNFTLSIGESIYVKVFRMCFVIGDVIGDECNIYYFKSTDTDSLQLGSVLSGVLAVMLKAPSETGLNPDIVAGRQGSFVTNEWMQYMITAVSLNYIVDATFNGRLAYAKEEGGEMYGFDLSMGPAESAGDQTIPGSSGDYIANAQPTNWSIGECTPEWTETLIATTQLNPNTEMGDFN